MKRRQVLKMWLGVVALVIGLGEAATAQGASLRGRYYMVVFGYQGLGNKAVDSHTFAAFYEGDSLERGASYPLSISWLPETGVVRPLRREPGRNFSLQETLNIARSKRYRVQAYGPYEISYNLYRRAQDRVFDLESGRWDYKMIVGPFSDREGVVNCIAALSFVGGPLNTGTNWGYAASSMVTEHLSPSIFGYPNINRNVARMIGLDRMVSR